MLASHKHCTRSEIPYSSIDTESKTHSVYRNRMNSRKFLCGSQMLRENNKMKVI